MFKRDYEEAIAVQDACNLSGVVFKWAEIMRRICDESHEDGHGTDWRNSHPINILFAEKCSQLTGNNIGNIELFGKAYEECREMINAAEETV